MPPTARKTPADRKPRKTSTTRTSRPAVAEDPESKYAPTAWGNTIGGAEDLVVPSGQTCLVKRPGVQGLMESGVIRDMDSLSALVNEKHVKRVQGPGKEPEVDISSLMGDEDGLKNVLHVVDRVVCEVVLKPSVSMTPNDPTSRREGVIYADMIDLMDKMFIFNFAVGGTRGLESFRNEFESVVGGVDAVEAAG